MLVSVNPFKQIKDLYSDDKIKNYQKRSFWENPPHVFGIAENAYYALTRSRKNQCVIIAGESGAGKTEVCF